MAEKIERHFKRIYLPQAKSIDIDWPVKPEWLQQPKSLFAGDTLHVFARFEEKPAGTVFLNADFGNGLNCTQQITIEEPTAKNASNTLARLTANARLNESASREEIVRLATEYQLLCEHTAYLVTDIRAEKFKTDGIPNLRKVPIMLASGWGGIGRKSLRRASMRMNENYVNLLEPTVERLPILSERLSSSEDLDFLDMPAFLRRQAYDPAEIISADSRWKCKDENEINNILKTGSLNDLQVFGILAEVLLELQDIKEALPFEISEHQLIVAFFHQWVTAQPNDPFNEITSRMIKAAFEQEGIDGLVTGRIYSAIFETKDRKQDNECLEEG